MTTATPKAKNANIQSIPRLNAKRNSTTSLHASYIYPSLVYLFTHSRVRSESNSLQSL